MCSDTALQLLASYQLGVAVVAQELINTHGTTTASTRCCLGYCSLVYRGCCLPLKLKRKYSRADLPSCTSYFEKHELLCPYSSIDIANHTGGVYKLSEKLVIYN